jgi:hypothetical protein
VAFKGGRRVNDFTGCCGGKVQDDDLNASNHCGELKTGAEANQDGTGEDAGGGV